MGGAQTDGTRMSRPRWLLPLALVARLLASPLALGSFGVWPALAQSGTAVKPYSPPRTPDGHPDFQGVWSNAWLTPLERIGPPAPLSVSPEIAAVAVKRIRETAARLGDLANDPEAGNPDAYSLAPVRGEFRTRLIVEPADGLLPYTPAGLKAVSSQQIWFGQRVMSGRGEGPEDRLTWERCLAGMGQAPMLFGWSINALRRVVQTPDALVIYSEAGGETRIIRIGGKPLPETMPSFIGDSIGHWDGDTLVAETTGFRSDDQFRMSIVGRSIMVRPQAKVIERFTRIADDELNYQFTVEDPEIYAQPWLAEYSMKLSSEPMYEFACHEGNYGLPNILAGARAGERRKAAAAER
jgi:hypothetical protein